MGWTLVIAGAVIVAGMILRYALWESHVGTLVEAGKLRDAFAVYLRTSIIRHTPGSTA